MSNVTCHVFCTGTRGEHVARRLGRTCAVFLCTLLVAIACADANVNSEAADVPTPPASSVHPLVDAYISAFNQHDPAAMAALMHPDIEVYYVDNAGTAALGTRGRDTMESELLGYFSQIPDVNSKVADAVVVNGRYRSYTETVAWTRNGESQVQSSLAVLEFDEALLRRVWYYPAQR